MRGTASGIAVISVGVGATGAGAGAGGSGTGWGCPRPGPRPPPSAQPANSSSVPLSISSARIRLARRMHARGDGLCQIIHRHGVAGAAVVAADHVEIPEAHPERRARGLFG